MPALPCSLGLLDIQCPQRWTVSCDYTKPTKQDLVLKRTEDAHSQHPENILPQADYTVLKRILLLWEGQAPPDRQTLLWRPHSAGSEQQVKLEGIFPSSASKLCVCLSKARWRAMSLLPQDCILESSRVISGCLAPLEKSETSDFTELLSRAHGFVLCWWMHQTHHRTGIPQANTPAPSKGISSIQHQTKSSLNLKGKCWIFPEA